jgi:DNA-binding NarL/FixJ family response regulator
VDAVVLIADDQQLVRTGLRMILDAEPDMIIGETTVKTHVTRTMMKLGVRDRVQAVVPLTNWGSLPPAVARPDRDTASAIR